MEKSLKDGNKLSLYVVMLANLCLFYLVAQNPAIATGHWFDLLRNASTAVPAGLASPAINLRTNPGSFNGSNWVLVNSNEKALQCADARSNKPSAGIPEG
jgi:hypothetical protein